ncbi:MAG: hypothetical protein K0Q79_1500 [Flavipsychrobacter sp.]|jgi:hypothetical protein|nr:hypothetical protein [Flavipsychrobacter sp.]
MSQINLSIGELLLEQYGHDSKRYKPLFPSLPPEKAGLYWSKDKKYYLPVMIDVGSGKVPGTQTEYRSLLGVKGDEGQYTGKWHLPHPVMSIELNAHIVDTELTERDGLVSELVNVSGYKIHIKGLLINRQSNDFPAEDFDTLNRLFNLKIPVKIVSEVTNILLRNNPEKLVTIRSLKFPEHPGVRNVRPYELELYSEMPFSLIDIS